MPISSRIDVHSTFALILTGVLVLGAGSLQAQKRGQSAKIQHGLVVGADQVDLNDSKATQGALVGGTIALAATHSKSSKKRRRSTATAAIVGGAIGSAAGGSKMGMMYTVAIAGGAIKVVTDQIEIQVDDCVVVEETGQGANIRRVDAMVCDPAAAGAVEALESEFQEEAAECSSAKAEVAAAQTNEDVDLAMRKVSILCNG